LVRLRRKVVTKAHEGTQSRAQVTETVPALPGIVMLITPPQVHIAVQPECSAGWPSTITLTAPGIHGEVVIGMHGAGEKTPSLAAVAAATTGFDIVPHMPKVGMLTIGANAWMFAAGISLHWTGVPIGTTVRGTGTGGIANEHDTIAPLLTSGGIGTTLRPPPEAM
jgi:hypothetical protein